MAVLLWYIDDYVHVEADFFSSLSPFFFFFLRVGDEVNLRLS